MSAPPAEEPTAPSRTAGELESLLRHPAIWRGGDFQQQGCRSGNVLSSGFRLLDQQLPGGGWGDAMLVEILLQRPGSGELRLLLPLLSNLSRRQQWQLWIAPPWIPYAPALIEAGVDLDYLLVARTDSAEEVLWTAEQALRAGVCGAVLLWLSDIDHRCLKRLQLAAEAGKSRAFLFRPAAVRKQPSPAPVRLLFEASVKGMGLRILKCRGRGPSVRLISIQGPAAK